MKTELSLAAVVLLGTAIGFGMPLGDAEDRAGDGETMLAASSDPGESRAAAPHGGWGDEVSLQRAYDGHFYAEVMLDGTPTRMLVDTGASVIALTADDAAAAGIYWSENELAPVAQGAGGLVYGVNVTIPRVSIDGFEANNLRAIVVPDGLPVSLLGQSYLATINTVKIAGDRMVLGN